MKNLFKSGAVASLRALQKMQRPIFAVQACALLVVLAYYFVPAFKACSASLASWNASTGLIGAAITTVLASVLLPRLFQVIVRWKGVQSRGSDLLFEAGYFAFLGVEIALFYQLQSLLFGSEPTFAVVVKKIAFDIFVFTALWNMPFTSVVMIWRGEKFSVARTVSALKAGALYPRLGAFLVGAWAFWLPVMAAVYSLPKDLQFSLFLLAQAAWSLLLVAMDRAERSDEIGSQ